MKRIVTLIALTALLTACAGTEDINASRGVNSSRVTQAELDQYNKQRSNEIYEAQTQAEKAAGYSSVIQSGASAIQSGVGAINSVRGLFGF